MAAAKPADVHTIEKEKNDVWMDLDDLEAHPTSSPNIHSGTMFETFGPNSIFPSGSSQSSLSIHHTDTTDERDPFGARNTTTSGGKHNSSTNIAGTSKQTSFPQLHLDSLPNSQNASQSAPVTPTHSSFAGPLIGVPPLTLSIDTNLSNAMNSSHNNVHNNNNNSSSNSNNNNSMSNPQTMGATGLAASSSSASAFPNASVFGGGKSHGLSFSSSFSSDHSGFSGFSTSTSSGSSNYSAFSNFSTNSFTPTNNHVSSFNTGPVANTTTTTNNSGNFLQQPPFHALHKSTSHPVGLSMHYGGSTFGNRDRGDSTYSGSGFGLGLGSGYEGYDFDRRSSTTTSSSLNSPGGNNNAYDRTRGYAWGHDDGLASPSASFRGLAIDDGGSETAVGPDEDGEEDYNSSMTIGDDFHAQQGGNSTTINIGGAHLRALGRSVSHDSNLAAFLRGDGLLLGSPIKREHSHDDFTAVTGNAGGNGAWGFATQSPNARSGGGGGNGAGGNGAGGNGGNGNGNGNASNLAGGSGGNSETSSLQASPTPKDGAAPQKRTGLRPNGGAGVFAAAAAATANASGGMIPPSPKSQSRKQKKTTSIRRTRDASLKKVGGFEVTSRVAPVSAIEIDSTADGKPPKTQGTSNGLPRIVSGGRLQRRRKGGVSPSKQPKRAAGNRFDESEARPGIERKRSKSLDGELDWRSPGNNPNGEPQEPKISVVMAQIVEPGSGGSTASGGGGGGGGGVVMARSMTDSDLASHLKEKGRKPKGTRKKAPKPVKSKKGKSRRAKGDDTAAPTTATIAPVSRAPVMAGVVSVAPVNSSNGGAQSPGVSMMGSNATMNMNGVNAMGVNAMSGGGVRTVGHNGSMQMSYGSNAGYNGSYYGNMNVQANNTTYSSQPTMSTASTLSSRTKSMETVNNMGAMYNTTTGAGVNSSGYRTNSMYNNTMSAGVVTVAGSGSMYGTSVYNQSGVYTSGSSGSGTSGPSTTGSSRRRTTSSPWGSQNISCPYNGCGKIFSLASELDTHIRTYHATFGDEGYAAVYGYDMSNNVNMSAYLTTPVAATMQYTTDSSSMAMAPLPSTYTTQAMTRNTVSPSAESFMSASPIPHATYDGGVLDLSKTDVETSM